LQKISDIGTSDEENEHDGAEKGIRNVLGEAEKRVLERLHFFADALVGFGMLLRDALGDDVHFGLRLLEGDAGLHAGEGHEPVVLAGGIARAGGVFGLPEVQGIAREVGNPRRHDADDGAENASAANSEGLADDAGVAVVVRFPERIGEDDGFRELLHFVGRKDAAEKRVGVEEGKVVGSDVELMDGLLAFGRGDEGGVGVAGESDVFEYVVLRLPV